MLQEIHLTISGRVQGVFYRKEARNKAQELGLTGFVRNNPDGTVLALVQGEEQILKKFIEWCWKGPAEARVENIQIIYKDPEKIFEDFQIRYLV